MSPSSLLLAKGFTTLQSPEGDFLMPVIQTNQTQFSLGQWKAQLLSQGCSYMKHHLSHSLQKYSKEKNNETGVCFFITITASHFQAQWQLTTQRQLPLLKWDLPFGRGHVWKTSASNTKMPESYEQRNERFLQLRQFCNLGRCFSCCCSNKNLLLKN